MPQRRPTNLQLAFIETCRRDAAYRSFDMSGGRREAQPAGGRLLDGGSGLWRTRCSFETCDEAVDVAQDPEISDQLSVEGEDRRAVPPDVPTGRIDVKKLASVIAMKSKLSEDLVPLFPEGKDVRRVAIERTGDELHIPDELLVADQLGTQRPAEREVGMEDLRHQCDVGLVPHLLVEDSYGLLLARPVDLSEIQWRLVHLWMTS